jgi:hypothetical protein
MPREQRDEFLARVTACADNGCFQLLHPALVTRGRARGNAESQ